MKLTTAVAALSLIVALGCSKQGGGGSSRLTTSSTTVVCRGGATSSMARFASPVASAQAMKT